MESVRELIRSKPRIYLVISALYLFGIGLLHWRTHPDIGALLFLAGGAIGVYFLDAAELFFHLTPSPFTSIVFSALFTAVGFFIVTSSGSPLAEGLVLSLYLQMVLRQIGEWRVSGGLDAWYRMVAVPVSRSVQKAILIAFAALFLIETYIFIV